MLENKVVRLENIIEILKSANCTPKSPLKQKLYAAEQFYGEYSVHVICDAFDIPRGTFYNHVLRNKKDNTLYTKRKEEMRHQIQEIYDESNQIYKNSDFPLYSARMKQSISSYTYAGKFCPS